MPFFVQMSFAAIEGKEKVFYEWKRKRRIKRKILFVCGACAVSDQYDWCITYPDAEPQNKN